MARRTAEELAAQMMALAQELQTLKGRPQDTYQDGDVVRIVRTFNDKKNRYMYAAIKARGKWFLTQSSRYSVISPMTWDELIDWLQIDKGNVVNMSVCRLGEWIVAPDYDGTRENYKGPQAVPNFFADGTEEGVNPDDPSTYQPDDRFVQVARVPTDEDLNEHTGGDYSV